MQQKYRVLRNYKTMENGAPVWNYRAQQTILPGRVGRYKGLDDNEDQWHTVATFENGEDAVAFIDLYSKGETKKEEIVYQIEVEVEK